MTSCRHISKLASKSELLDAVDYLIDIEFDRTGSPWISRQRLCESFLAIYGIDLEAIAKLRGLGKDLRYFLAEGQRYSIYQTPNPAEFYLARRSVLLPGVLKSGSLAPRLRDRLC